QARKLADAGESARFLQLQWSPDGERIAFMKSRTSAGKSEVSIESLQPSQVASTLILSNPNLYSFCWTADGHLVYSLQEAPPKEKDTNLWKLLLDPGGGKPKGEPERITSWAGFSFWDLSVTADSKRLAFVKAGSQSDVYAGELDAKGQFTRPPYRVTLDERNDWPSAWMPDNRTVLFHSDRNGHWQIFKQAVDQPTAEEVIPAGEDQMEPQASPDGSFVLYWAFTRNNGQTA